MGSKKLSRKNVLTPEKKEGVKQMMGNFSGLASLSTLRDEIIVRPKEEEEMPAALPEATMKKTGLKYLKERALLRKERRDLRHIPSPQEVQKTNSQHNDLEEEIYNTIK